tara:strand:- start:774 stop:1187 length:414 start_codon:yes stop_codon:yes gene_type:complete
MEEYKEYCNNVYNKGWEYNPSYSKNRIKEFEEKEYHITFQNKKLSLPIQQYKIYYIYKISEFNRHTYKENYEYKFDEYDNFLTEYLNLLYEFKSISYRWNRKHKIKSKIMNTLDYSAYIRSFLEYDKMRKMVRDFKI